MRESEREMKMRRKRRRERTGRTVARVARKGALVCAALGAGHLAGQFTLLTTVCAAEVGEKAGEVARVRNFCSSAVRRRERDSESLKGTVAGWGLIVVENESTRVCGSAHGVARH